MIEKISVVANLWIKLMQFEHIGEVFNSHKHTFDHQTVVSVGIVKVKVNGNKEKIYKAPTILTIKKDSLHEISSITNDAQILCIHPLRKSESIDDIFDPEDCPILSEAYPIVRL